jgi:hypothetical protein
MRAGRELADRITTRTGRLTIQITIRGSIKTLDISTISEFGAAWRYQGSHLARGPRDSGRRIFATSCMVLPREYRARGLELSG